MTLNTYLNFAGNCEEAFRFYQQHLGAGAPDIMRFRQMPEAEQHMPPGMGDKVLHARITLGETSLMGADVPGSQPMRSAYLTLTVNTDEEAERIYQVLSEGGEVLMKMTETFFAFRFGQVRDRFGVNWMILHPRPMPAA